MSCKAAENSKIYKLHSDYKNVKQKKELEQLADELTEEDVTLLLDGPGDPPSPPPTMFGVFLYGHKYIEKGELYRNKVKRYNELKERYKGTLDIWLRKNSRCIEKREEKKVKKIRNKKKPFLKLVIDKVRNYFNDIERSQIEAILRDEYKNRY